MNLDGSMDMIILEENSNQLYINIFYNLLNKAGESNLCNVGDYSKKLIYLK